MNPIHWSGNPVIFTLPRLTFPFEISFIGLAFSIAIYFVVKHYFGGGVTAGVSSSKDRSKNRKSRSGGKSGGTQEKRTDSPWLNHPIAPWVVGLLAVIVGQVLALPFDGPGLSGIGPIAPRWYGLMFAFAFFFGYLAGARYLRLYGLSHEQTDRLLMYVLVSTVIGARLGHVIFYDLSYYLQNPGLIFAIWEGGLASHGAAISIPYALWLFSKKTPGATFLGITDRVAIGVAIGGFFIRIGNFFNSEILGQPTDLPWAVVFERVDLLPRHPTMLYESLWCLVVLAAVLWVHHRGNGRPADGRMFGMFLTTLFSGRFFIEFTKVPQAEFASDWAINMGQWLSVPLVALGLWLLLRKMEEKTSAAG